MNAYKVAFGLRRQKRRVVPLLVTLLPALLLGNPAKAATITFPPPVTYPVGTAPKAAAVGDFNGDGKPDLAVANAGNPATGDDGNVSILLGNGDGTFQPAAHNFAAGKNPFSVAVGDFNGDSRVDLAVVNNGINIDGGWLAGTVSILLGNGDGTFQTHVDFATGTGPDSVAVGDFNADGMLDLVVAAHPANVVSVLLGKGDGTFQTRVDYPTGTAGGNSSVVVADFNQDGKADLAVAGGFSGGIVGILEGNGDGTFQPAVEYDPAGLFGRSIAVGDFNGDSRLDLAITFASFGNPTASGVSVLLGNGDGTFSQGSNLPTQATGCHAGSPFSADFDGDGKFDIAVIGGGGPHDGVCLFVGAGTILVFKGNSDGTFQAPVSLATTNAWDLGAGADLNGDKAADLVTVDGIIGNGDNNISLLLNTTGADFSISAAAPTPGAVSRGQRSTSTLSLGHLNSFDNPVALTCSVQPAQSAPTCSFNPSSVTFDGNGNATATLTINTGAATASLVPLGHDSVPLQFLWPVAVFGMVGAGLGSRCFTRRKLMFYVLGAVLFGGLIVQGACGGSGGPGSTTYTITITGTSSSTNHSTTVPLIVK
jgi:hypothetical protein